MKQGVDSPLTVSLTDNVRSLTVTRSRLRHSWLENQLLNCDVAYVQRIHGSSSQARRIFEQMIGPKGTFDQMVQEGWMLCHGVRDTLDPVRLMDSIPLSSL